jgi:alpha-tubulin suppressor-like RCC1 family protein
MKNLFMLVSLFLPPVAISAQIISGGAGQSLVICNKTLEAWGNNSNGQLGNGTNINSNFPIQVNSLSDVTAGAAGVGFSIALKTDGTVWTWGGNLYGMLGNGTNADSNIPIQVSFLTDITAVSGGSYCSLALKNDGTVSVWGLNNWGQLGNGTNTNSNVPQQVSSLTGVTAIAAGEGYSLALKNDGTIWAWGWNGYGLLGNGTQNLTNSNIPMQVSSLTGITAIAASQYYALALKNDGTVWYWGSNLDSGQNVIYSNSPLQVSSLIGITAIAAGTTTALAVKNDGTIWAWGNNLGNGTNSTYTSIVPVQVTSLTGITAIAGADAYSLALKNDGTLWSWGINNLGQLGNGTNIDSNIPVQVLGLCQSITSINQIEEKEVAMNVFPNPTSRIITVNIIIPNAKAEFLLEVIDSFGKIVYSETIKEISLKLNKQIDFNMLPKGNYFIELQSTSTKFPLKKIEVKKIVLQ